MSEFSDPEAYNNYLAYKAYKKYKRKYKLVQIGGRNCSCPGCKNLGSKGGRCSLHQKNCQKKNETTTQ